MYYVSDKFLQSLILEDMPYGDATVRLLGIENKSGRIECLPKADGHVSGVTLAERMFKSVGLTVQRNVEDGARVTAGTVILSAEGSAGAIHAVYKTAQNVMEYCSGITERTAAMVSEARRGNLRCRVVTTRKHFPGTKTLSLYAAIQGGALVHRMGLSESLLVFDQHRVFMNNAGNACWRDYAKNDPERKLAVEAASVSEALNFARQGADIVQCERFEPEEVAALKTVLKNESLPALVSVAGGITEKNAFDYAAAGADFLVTSRPYFGRPFDVKMRINAVS